MCGLLLVRDITNLGKIFPLKIILRNCFNVLIQVSVEVAE